MMTDEPTDTPSRVTRSVVFHVERGEIMQKPTTYPIRHDFPGRLSTMPHPTGDTALEADLATLRERGTDILVSALTPREQDELSLTAEGTAATNAGMEFHAIPIGDFGIPDREQITPTLTHLLERLHGGAHVVVHCWAGIGRSSLLAASLLVLDGVDPADAWQLISDARGVPVPETDEQRAWVDAFHVKHDQR
jgi:protein-tyrosine phosphatase